ncbi:serine protease inhibitor ecotin [Paenalcaligenes niemegkensis]|uniref:serine protease inhibitor ecotin n=1 Tax=Paenalcaligenes niemegkensis TaxID=2895469 RepID=UPI001EE879EC|nr:serine protease inhibitor ecotin [Paenalcaligenes niemegkensis]MCQ9617505.1 serine protease inhibitor ecotin [Paenalcaligenes niemegkensis]
MTTLSLRSIALTALMSGLLSLSLTSHAQPEEASNAAPAAEAPAEAIENSDPLEAFPAAKAGFTRHVIRLPIGNFENDLRIELLPGKVIDVDCNTTQFIGQLEEKTLDGWGYNYYILPEIEGPVATLMACPDESKRKQFVPVSSAGSLLHYNSRMPVVVYLPNEVELRWRTWVATPVVNAEAE